MTDALDLQTLQVFRYIRDYIRNKGMPPSQREIARGTFMAATTMIVHLTRLEMRGWLHREYNIPRSIRIGEFAPSDDKFEELWQEMLEAEDEGESP